MNAVLDRILRGFVRDYEQTGDPAVRQRYGVLAGGAGIVLNLLLFAGKLAAGLLTGAISVTADAFNNLSDAATSVVTLLGFRLAGQKADAEHPFGHGRMEYLAGLIVSLVILVVGVELGKSSVEKIISPAPVEAGLLPAAILLVSIAVKLYMSAYNRAVGKKIGSAAMEATAADSLSDSISTLVALLSMAVSYIFGWNIDGWAGLAVAVFICIAGIGAAKDTMSPLLGKAPDAELVQQIREIVLAHPEVRGIHDLIVHDYGPGRLVVSLHAEVDGYGNIFELHDAIDRAERELKAKLGCIATIHMDPIEADNTELARHRHAVTELLQARISPQLTVHDFRMVPGPTHTNLIFDAAVPVDLDMSDEALAAEIRRLVHSEWEEHYAIVTIDRVYA